ncbi:MAG: zinc metallopeptidase, partial [Desulfobacterales bacterium]|nr:zinc metallopeptidase [Desulfobacterales bacterium]
MDKESKIIGVLPLGETSETAVKVIMAHIAGYLNLAPAALPPGDLPRRAFDESRLQYDAAILLERLESMAAPGRDKIIGV